MSTECAASYDLHLHSFWSYDATADLEPYFRLARERGMRCLAVTDHHVMDGAEEVAALAERFPEVRSIPAAELSVHASIGAVDLVCLGLPSVVPPVLSAVLDEYHDWQRRCGAAFAEGVRKLGFPYTDEARRGVLESYRPRRAIDVQGLTHVRGAVRRQYFIDQGWAADGKAYAALCGRVREVVDLPDYPEVSHVAAAVHAAGGLIALAHPAGYFLGADEARMDALREEIGFDGIECAHPLIPADLTPVYRRYCEERELLSTAGSDCHTPEDLGGKFGAHLGQDRWLDELLERLPA